jgi:hypothetical protein
VASAQDQLPAPSGNFSPCNNNHIITDTTPQFVWPSVSGANTYRIRVSSNDYTTDADGEKNEFPNFQDDSNNGANAECAPNGSGCWTKVTDETTLTMGFKLGTYHWQVRAGVLGEKGGKWSSTCWFKIEEIPPPDEPEMDIEPDEYDFGPVKVGKTSSGKLFTISNDGNADLYNIDFDDSSEFKVRSDQCGGTVRPGKNCTFKVEFTPKRTGNRSKSMKISSNAGTKSIDLSGTGTDTGKPILYLKRNPVDYGTLDIDRNGGKFKNFPLKNIGDVDATGFTFSNTLDSVFELDKNTCSNGIIKAGKHCLFEIVFDPLKRKPILAR